MSLTRKDVGAFETFVASRGKRVDQGRAFVARMIARLERDIAAAEDRKDPGPKYKEYRQSLDYWRGVGRVMAQLDGSEETAVRDG